MGQFDQVYIDRIDWTFRFESVLYIHNVYYIQLLLQFDIHARNRQQGLFVRQKIKTYTQGYLEISQEVTCKICLY